MPRRRRDAKRRAVLALTPQLHLALTVGPMDNGPTDELLVEVYSAHREQLLAESITGGDLPWAWWAYEPHVPDDLRGERLELYEVAPGEPATDPTDRLAALDLEERRAAWLAANPERKPR